MSPIKLEQQHDINSKENELEELLALGSISNHTKKIYYDLKLCPTLKSNIDDSNHSGQSFLRILSEQHKLVLTCAAFSTLFLSAGFLINQILRASIFLPTRINNSNASGLIEIINTWETDILSPQYLWLSAQNLQQDGHLQRSTHLLKYVPKNSELYADAQAEILALQNEIWEMAKARYEAGKQDEAIMIATSIQPDSPYYQDANNSAFEWKQAWKTDKPKAEKIITLAESTKWDDWMTVRSLYNELINPYWKNRVENIYQVIQGKIIAEQERLERIAQRQVPNTVTSSGKPITTSGGSNRPSHGISRSSGGSSSGRWGSPSSPIGNSSTGSMPSDSSSSSWSEGTWGNSSSPTIIPSNSDPFSDTGTPPKDSRINGMGQVLD